MHQSTNIFSSIFKCKYIEFLTFRISDERKPPIHRKHRSAGVFHIPDKMWNTSALAAMPFNLKISSNCVVTLSTIVRSSVSPACEFTAALSSFISLLCSSNQREYSTSNARAPTNQKKRCDRKLDKTCMKPVLGFFPFLYMMLPSSIKIVNSEQRHTIA